jgi:iduronate 2-sulfatase
MQLPPKLKDDWADIPKAGINYKTSKNMKMDLRRQKKAVGGYYASVAFMDRMVGQVLNGLKEAGLEDNTIVIFTSDHGYHLGEHDFWAKVSLHDESAAVPLIIRMPGKKPAVCHSLVELLDLYPTLSNLCGLEVPKHLQGKDISKMMTDPAKEVRSAAFSVNGKGFLLREQDWAYIAYGKNGQGDEELFDMKQDPKQFTNLANDPKHAQIIARFQKQMATKLREVRTNDLGLKY